MKNDYLSVDPNCPRICIGIHYSSPPDASIELCTFLFGISPAALKLEPERNWCRFDLLFILIRSVCAHALFPSQAIRSRVRTGVSGIRRRIDMGSSEYANFAPQLQHPL